MQAIARAETAEAERDEANADWHRMRDLHAAAITDLRAAEAERDEARGIADAAIRTGNDLRFRLKAAEVEVKRLNHENGALEAESRSLREGFEFSCQCGKSYVFPPPSDPRNRDDNPHPDGEKGT